MSDREVEKVVLVTGTIIKGNYPLEEKVSYWFKVDCPFCDGYHVHGLGYDPQKAHGTKRIAECLGGEYQLDVSGVVEI